MDLVRDLVIDYLSRRKFLTLATTTTKGEPLTHPIAYVNIDDTVYFSTNKKTRKVKNIKENPNVAYSVFDGTDHLDEIKLIQMEGTASILTDNSKAEEILNMIKKKFPSMADMPLDSDSIVVKITPKVAYFSDYTKRFGYREMVEY